MMKDQKTVAEDVVPLLSKAGYEELQRLKLEIAQIETARARTEGSGPAHSPKQSVVQRLAGERLEQLRKGVDVRPNPEKALTFEKIGEVYGVTRERARQLYRRLVTDAEASGGGRRR